MKNKNITVAVIDTGYEKADSSINFTSDSDIDINGHGTMIAETILANCGDRKPKIISIKAINDNGHAVIENVIQAIEYAIVQNVDIINMSFSAKAKPPSLSLKKVINKAIDKGIIVVASAGNKNDDAKNYIPACYKNVRTIGAIKKNYCKTKTSNYGKHVECYMVAKSTSRAAAMYTGWLVSGSKLNPAMLRKDRQKPVLFLYYLFFYTFISIFY